MGRAPSRNPSLRNSTFQTANVNPRSRGADRARVVAGILRLRKQRAQGRPGARCTRGLVCNMHKRKRTRAYRFSGGNPAFPAQWFYGLLRALPGDEFLLSPSSRGLMALRGPIGPAKTSADLTPATGARTTRLRRTLQRRSSCARRSLTEDRPAIHVARRRCCVHRIPPRVS
jgi:hypothetical protein